MLENCRKTFSALFLCWYIPLLKKGCSGKPLEYQDLDNHVPFKRNTSRNLNTRLSREWKAELEQFRDCGHTPSLVKAIVRTFKTLIILTGIIKFVTKCILDIMDRILFWFIIDHFSATSSLVPRNPFEDRFYIYAIFTIMTISVLRTYLFSAYYYQSEKLGIQIRTACSSMLYSKALRLSHGSLRSTGPGQMVNLLSTDGSKLETMFEIHHLWVGMIQMCMLAGLAWYHMGSSCIPGILLSILLAFFQGHMGGKLGKCRLESARASDKRLKVMSEIINAIRTIKMYAWEIPFSKVLQDRRRTETDAIQKHYQLRLVNWIIYCCTSSVTLFLTVATFWLINGNAPSAAAMFLCMRIFRRLRLYLSVDFPKALAHLNDFKVSARRFQDLLLLDELASLDCETEIDSDQKVHITAKNIISKWESVGNSNGGRPTICSVNIEATSRQLIAITGGVGSGKSSLLLTLLKELPLNSGKLVTFGRMAYVPQQPWIFAGTIRENILFGSNYNPAWYADVLEACALQQDLNSLPNGDLTTVSEGGSTLSGGQQARVSLARAVYADADIYLLDTPLSCVDPKVGKHILDNCILGLLRDKLTIVATHRMDLIQSADYVYLLDHGAVKEAGAPGKLLAGSTTLLSTITNNNFEDAQNFEHEHEECPQKEILQEIDNFEPRSTPSVIPGVPIQAYYEYFKAGITSTAILYKILTFTVITQLLTSGSDYWLKFSVEEGKNAQEFSIGANTVFSRLGINFAITALLILFSGLQMSTFLKICTAAGHHLHDKMFHSVLHAPVAFFTGNSPGHLLQRFSGDMWKVDEMLPFTIFYGVIVYIRCFFSIALVIVATDSKMVIPGACLMILAFQLQKMHVLASRSLNVLDNDARSPVLSHLCSSLQGISTVRAFGLISEMEAKFNTHLDLQFKSSYAKMTGLSWITAAMDAGVTGFINILLLSIIFIPAGGAEIGFALSAAYSLLNSLAWVLGSTSVMENQMKCVENIMDFHKIKPEKSSQLSSDKQFPKGWPSAGEIVFKDVCLAYVPGVKVLKNINLTISPGQKIGIVGRTGAGKSSLLAALFRLQEPTGTIEIDGVDITEIGLQTLRPRISIIPQDPVLFEGTLRTNLDPFNEFSDEEIVESLNNASLAQFVERNSSGIFMQIDEGGKNLSVGEKQLICMARAILRKNKILVSDEPTSNVDIETSSVIHEKMRKVFHDCTVLTIAHRVSTVMDCDKIIVMHQGEIKEFDSPDRLQRNPDSFFSQHILKRSSWRK